MRYMYPQKETERLLLSMKLFAAFSLSRLKAGTAASPRSF